MFTGFFFALKRYRVPISVTEWLCLMEALSLGFAKSNLTTFYYLARSVLVKSETYFDQYDQAFQYYFQGIDTPPEVTKDVLDWLTDPRNELNLTPEEIEQLKRLSMEELLEEFEKRLQEQTERHDGGSHWIGTGGTSPFGHSGANPGRDTGGGFRRRPVGDQNRVRNAVF